MLSGSILHERSEVNILAFIQFLQIFEKETTSAIKMSDGTFWSSEGRGKHVYTMPSRDKIDRR